MLSPEEALQPRFFCFDLPLYSIVETDKTNEYLIKELLTAYSTIDEYSPWKKEQTTYRLRGSKGNLQRNFGMHQFAGFGELELTCMRESGHSIKIFVFVEPGEDQDGSDRWSIQKIGQTPSIADLHISKIRQYDRVLSKPKLKEFTKAIGLAANGVGIGSFVYLRRIFEDLIEEAHIKNRDAQEWDEDKYRSSRMNERIEILKAHLPEFLIEHKEIYGILSKGLHELSEQECLDYFEPVKTGIEQILDEKVEKYEKEKRLKKASEQIKKLSQK